MSPSENFPAQSHMNCPFSWTQWECWLIPDSVRDLFWKETLSVVLLLGSFSPFLGNGWASPSGTVCSSILGWFGFFLSLANLLNVNIVYIKYICCYIIVDQFVSVASSSKSTHLLGGCSHQVYYHAPSIYWHHTIDWYYWLLIIIVIAWHWYSFIFTLLIFILAVITIGILVSSDICGNL